MFSADPDLCIIPTRVKKPPPSVICYICGRQFGSKSISIHEPQCLEKWRHQNAKLPKHQRRPEPKKPEASENAEVNNELAWEEFKKSLLVCQHCNRSFNPDSLKSHQKFCTEDNPHKPLPPK